MLCAVSTIKLVSSSTLKYFEGMLHEVSRESFKKNCSPLRKVLVTANVSTLAGVTTFARLGMAVKSQ
jgi:hypothetical protein